MPPPVPPPLHDLAPGAFDAVWRARHADPDAARAVVHAVALRPDVATAAQFNEADPFAPSTPEALRRWTFTSLDGLPRDARAALVRLVAGYPDGIALSDGTIMCWDSCCNCCPPQPEETLVWHREGAAITTWPRATVAAWVADRGLAASVTPSDPIDDLFARIGFDELVRPPATPAPQETTAMASINGQNATPTSVPQVKTTEQPILKTLQHDASDAAWRTAGSQFVKLTRAPLVGLLARHLGPDDDALRGRLATFLETEIGTALLASLLSVGLAAVPGAAGEVPQRLARELRVRAMAAAGDVVADVLMGPLRQVIALYLRDLPTVADAAAEPPGLADGARVTNVTELRTGAEVRGG